MPNCFETAAAVLGGALKTMAGRTITYTRRGQSFTATGTPHKVDYETDVDSQTGLALAVTFYDWTFTFSDLGFDNDDTLFEGLPGDQITETLNGVDYVYEVMPLMKRKAMEWVDSAGVLVVIHSKLTGKSLSA